MQIGSWGLILASAKLQRVGFDMCCSSNARRVGLDYCRFGNVRENLIFAIIREFVASRIQSSR